MGESVSLLTNLLLSSVRDPGGAATQSSFVLDMLSRCEQVLNDALELSLRTTTLTTLPFQCFYDLAGYVPNTISITHVREGDRDLSRLTSLDDLAAINRRWHQEVSTRHECFLQLGETSLVIYPARSVPSTLSVIGTNLTPQFASLLLDETTIDADNSPILLALTRAFLNLRVRQYDAMESSLQEFQELLQARRLTHATA